MRLFNINTLQFAKFRDDKRPKYAIASHRWVEGSEVTLQDVLNKQKTDKSGYRKIMYFAEYVQKHVPSVEWLWVDTCCIDKDSAAELSKSLNLMFDWYRNAVVCIAHLADVEVAEDIRAFQQSEWFKRGWTLQELLAPRLVVFVTKTWQVIGNKGASTYINCGTPSGLGLEEDIAAITGIPVRILRDYAASSGFSAEEKLRWIEGRTTTESEDMSYALYGIFGVRPGANYGEGYKGARQRLLAAIHQQENPTAQQSDHQKIVNWLSPPDPWTNHQSARQLHEPRTGTWLLQSGQYHNWMSASSRHLWVYGKAGCGKTILCSTVIEDIKEYCKSQSNAGYAVFYFSFSDDQKQRLVDLLRSLVMQLGWKGPALSLLQQAYDKSNRSVLGPDELESILVSCFESYDEVFLLVDALDECTEEGDVRNGMLACLARLSQKARHVKMFATSRELPDIRVSMVALEPEVEAMAIATHAVDVDIGQYVAMQILHNPRLYRLDPPTKALIKETISAKSDGMFRWAYCQLQKLTKLKSTRPKFVKDALYTLPATLDETYERMLTAIEDVLRPDALALLRWLAYAKSPPSLGELVEATIIDLTAEGKVDVEDRPGIEDALEILSGLVTTIGVEVNNESDQKEDAEVKWQQSDDNAIKPVSLRQQIDRDTKVRLAHFSVKEYLESKRILQSKAKDFHLELEREHKILTQSCLIYLTHYSSSDEKTSTEQDFTRFPLLQYAAQSWFYHGALQHVADVTLESRFLCTKDTLHDWLLIHLPDCPSVRPFQRLKETGTGLYYASFVGLEAVVGELLRYGADMHAQGGVYSNALQAASAGGHERVVQMLLDAGADIDARGPDHGTALHAASRKSHPNVVQLLMKRGAKITTDYNNMTALHYAAQLGYEAVVRTLLAAGVPVDVVVRRKIWVSTYRESGRHWKPRDDNHRPSLETTARQGLTTLHYAALTGSSTMTRFLLEQGADPNALSEYGETPFHLALKGELYGADWRSGHEDHWNDPAFRVEYSLDLVDDVSGDEYYMVQAEIDRIRLEVLDMLIKNYKTSFSAKDCYGATPLHCVRFGTRISSIILPDLLSRSVDVDQADIFGRTALHLACLKGDVEAIELLVAHGAKFENSDSDGMNSLHFAAKSGDERTICLVLEYASRAQLTTCAKAKDCNGRNALHIFLECSEHVGIGAVRLLLMHGAGINDLTDDGYSPLALYLHRFFDRSRHKAEIADLLFQMGADPLFQHFGTGQNLGHRAASAYEIGVELLETLGHHGVDLSAEDNNGRTILHYCASKVSLGEDNALRFLCDHVGLLLDSRDKFGKSPLEIANERKLEIHDWRQFRPDRWHRTDGLLRELTISY